MGKKRITLVGEIPSVRQSRTTEGQGKRKTGLPDKTRQRRVKSGKEHGRLADVAAEALAEAAVIEEKTKKLEAEVAAKGKKAPKAKTPTALLSETPRGKRYQQAKKLLDKNKFYSLTEAIKLLKSISISRFNGSVDVHLITRKIGLKGEIKFPNPTGKTQKIRIADEKLLAELEKGKINFTGLVTTPAIMPKLAKYAKLLGPRGLMPNPKTGTITDKPEELVKELADKINWRTEAKAPLIHLSIGKVNSPEKHLEENFRALIEAVNRRNIKKAVLAPTMGPGIKISLDRVATP